MDISNSRGWSSDFKYNLSLLGYIVGLNNIQDGSLALIRAKMGVLGLVPLFFVTVVVKIPCIFLELVLGQYSGRTALNVWKFCPILKGIGVYGLLVLFFYQMFTNITLAHLLTFVLTGFQRNIEWTSCNESWANKECIVQENQTYIVNNSVEIFWENYILDYEKKSRFSNNKQFVFRF